jgi:hypothetical protein
MATYSSIASCSGIGATEETRMVKHEDVFERHGFNKRFDHVARVIVNANHGIMRATAKLCCGA